MIDALGEKTSYGRLKTHFSLGETPVLVVFRDFDQNRDLLLRRNSVTGLHYDVLDLTQFFHSFLLMVIVKRNFQERIQMYKTDQKTFEELLSRMIGGKAELHTQYYMNSTDILNFIVPGGTTEQGGVRSS